MKANGRRRWRKFARHVRQREPGEFSNTSGHGALLKKQPYRAYRDPGPIPAKPFTARSLVGMTQGARKRAARYDTLKASNRTVEPSMKRYVLILFHRDYRNWTERGKGHYLADCAKYRIGERLRPCPGCRSCGFQPRGEVWIDLKTHLSREVFRICDGSGVLPARKQATK